MRRFYRIKEKIFSEYLILLKIGLHETIRCTKPAPFALDRLLFGSRLASQALILPL